MSILGTGIDIVENNRIKKSLFGKKTNFKNNKHNWLIPCSKKCDEFKNRLSNLKKIKVGMSWRSSGVRSSERNISLIRLASIFPKKNRAIVKGVNLVKKHQKPSKQSGGGIIEKELSIHISNLTFLSLKDGKKIKIGYKFENNKKIRIEKKTGEIIRNV